MKDMDNIGANEPYSLCALVDDIFFLLHKKSCLLIVNHLLILIKFIAVIITV